ncbi:MAG: nuclear transport factor 2 family protein [Cyanobacteria bacterium SZAS-4]|nr:nuclear transport factor 2 family protein [Cyanobacteria bacterium SZAS-4]
MRTSPRKRKQAAPHVVASILLASFCALPSQAIETSTVVTTPGAAANSNDFTLDPDNKEHEAERKEIEELLTNIETQWNAHNLDSVMSYYADDYINNDGLDKKAVSKLTEDFWKTYPDAKSSSKTKSIRIEGNFATVESRDMAVGSTAKEMPGINTKGDLNSISEGQLYIKKFGTNWKIIGDRIDYEKVRVAFGLAKTLNASFSAPEQVKSGRQYSAKLELNLPTGLTAVGSITSQPLEYPQPQPADAWRPLDGTVLERIMPANTNNRNELLMATIGITNSNRNNLMGITFLTRRLNVVPSSEDKFDKIITAEKSVDKTTEKIEKTTTPHGSLMKKESVEKIKQGSESVEKSIKEPASKTILHDALPSKDQLNEQTGKPKTPVDHLTPVKEDEKPSDSDSAK